MNYIILDMEWDSAYIPKYKRFINQILQIGAVKLNEQFEIIDTFEATVKSAVSKKLSNRFTTLTGITKDMMQNGIPLDKAVKNYNNWIGEDTVTMTWSNSDLYTILENEKFLLTDIKFKIDMYLDLQKYIQGELKILGFDCQSQISLSNAASLLNVTTEDYELHTAKDDSLLSAQLLRNHFCKERFEQLVKDTSNPEFYRRLLFKSYYINDINDETIKKSHLEFQCKDCNLKMQRKTKWRFHNRNFIADFYCSNCKKKFICRVSFRKTYDDVVVKRHISDFKVKIKEKRGENQNDLQPLSKKL